jgi:predicted RNA-binding protein associated with RNAse of E/G family
VYYSVSRFLGPDGEPHGWYVDFIRPYPRTPSSVDTFDLMLDLVIEPDLSLRWKDEDEYAQGRRLGIIPDDEHKQVQLAREEVIGLFEERSGPFDDRWHTWRPETNWPLPVLPADALLLPAPTHPG